MRPRMIVTTLLLACGGAAMGCAAPSTDGSAMTAAQSLRVDPELTAYIASIRAVDNHTHANTIAPGDSESDALPLEVISPFEVPVRLNPEKNPDWLNAYKALYNYPHQDMNDAHVNELRGLMQGVAKQHGEKFPSWVLDRIGTEV